MTKTHNPEEIDLGDDSSDSDEEVEEMELKKQPVPSQVFGGLAKNNDDNDDDDDDDWLNDRNNWDKTMQIE